MSIQPPSLHRLRGCGARRDVDGRVGARFPRRSSAAGSVHQQKADMELHIRDVSKTYSNGVQALKNTGYEFPRRPYFSARSE
jgi:hypothetical protein